MGCQHLQIPKFPKILAPHLLFYADSSYLSGICPLSFGLREVCLPEWPAFKEHAFVCFCFFSPLTWLFLRKNYWIWRDGASWGGGCLEALVFEVSLDNSEVSVLWLSHTSLLVTKSM